MSNITANIENVLSQLDQAGATGAVMASVAWSFAMSLAQNRAAAIRIDNDDDPDSQRLNADQRDDRRTQINARGDQIADTLGWAVSYASPDYRPTGADVARMIIDADPASYGGESDASLDEVATALGMSVEDVCKAAEADRQRQVQNRQLQQQVIEANIAEIAQAVDRAIEAGCSQAFELTDRDAERVLERIATKAEQYEQNRVAQALRTRRKRRLAQFAAERLLLQSVMDAADALIDRLSDAEAKREHAAANDYRVVY